MITKTKFKYIYYSKIKKKDEIVPKIPFTNHTKSQCSLLRKGRFRIIYFFKKRKKEDFFSG